MVEPTPVSDPQQEAVNLVEADLARVPSWRSVSFSDSGMAEWFAERHRSQASTVTTIGLGSCEWSILGERHSRQVTTAVDSLKSWQLGLQSARDRKIPGFWTG